jgi:hypothetical protein
MWKRFVPNGEGVALQSTFELLEESFNIRKKLDVYVGKVEYIDYASPPVPEDNHFIYRALRKDVYRFECEHELRALIISKILLDKPETHDIRWNKLTKGIYVPVNVENLVEKVVVSPSSNNLLFNAVRSVTKKYFPNTDFYKRVLRSNLDNNRLPT